MRRMNLGLGVAIASVGVVGLANLMAGMDFEINYLLAAPGPASNSGKNTLALPYVRKAGVDTAHQLMLDIGGGTVSPVTSVAQFREVTDTFCVFTGRPLGTPCQNFALSSGEGYFVSMNTTVNYTITGSHDPALVISMDAPGPNSSTGKNFLAPPYHTTAANALDLMKDIDGSGGGIASVANVSRFNKATDTFIVYTGRMGSPVLTPFPLTAGEAYFVSMLTSRSYIPSHF